MKRKELIYKFSKAFGDSLISVLEAKASFNYEIELGGFGGFDPITGTGKTSNLFIRFYILEENKEEFDGFVDGIKKDYYGPGCSL